MQETILILIFVVQLVIDSRQLLIPYNSCNTLGSLAANNNKQAIILCRAHAHVYSDTHFFTVILDIPHTAARVQHSSALYSNSDLTSDGSVHRIYL